MGREGTESGKPRENRLGLEAGEGHTMRTRLASKSSFTVCSDGWDLATVSTMSCRIGIRRTALLAGGGPGFGARLRLARASGHLQVRHNAQVCNTNAVSSKRTVHSTEMERSVWVPAALLLSAFSCCLPPTRSVSTFCMYMGNIDEPRSLSCFLRILKKAAVMHQTARSSDAACDSASGQRSKSEHIRSRTDACISVLPGRRTQHHDLCS